MKLLHNLKVAALAACILGFTAAGANAQQTTTPQKPAQQQPTKAYSDADMKQFADANNRLMALQQVSEQKMMKILEEEHLSVEKFNQMAQAHQQQKLTEVQATPEEMAAFNKSAQRIMELQPTLQTEAEAAIKKDGMALDKYQEMMTAYQQDPAFQEKVNKLMVKE
ncbi:DUF4168 domain-containing protein [Pontibacter liquoris]|uniref:DUF4168 domain-containing protein n=1 Tax=Pontibacter liquoris TaxID=2905677 RepID=UPI001FA7ECD3|nr:DUF4168 domain-containing protein [Pontibacter liquoris]